MKKGDILLVHHKLDPVAWLIRKVTKSHWNHVAWAIDSHFLIEARGCAIDTCSIKKYLNWKYNVKLIRLKKVTKEQFKEAIRYISQFKGKRSYYGYIKTILKMLCFKNDAFIRNITCSGLISKGLDMGGYNFIPPHRKKPNLITPEDIAQAPSCNVTDELEKVVGV